ncbi:MAG: hypothetical protein WDM89_10250 [Rhizomicrobium sp.]
MNETRPNDVNGDDGRDSGKQYTLDGRGQGRGSYSAALLLGERS